MILLAFPVNFVKADGSSETVFVCDFEDESADMLIAHYTNSQEAVKYILINPYNNEEVDTLYFELTTPRDNEYYGSEAMTADTLLFFEEVSGTRDRGHEDGVQQIYIDPNCGGASRISTQFSIPVNMVSANINESEESKPLYYYLGRIFLSALLLTLSCIIIGKIFEDTAVEDICVVMAAGCIVIACGLGILLLLLIIWA
jgi:hypothetical protein